MIPGDANAVFAVGPDKDEGHTGRVFGVPHDVRQAHPLPPESCQGVVPKRVLSQAGDKGHIPAGAGSGDGLVRALPARRPAEHPPSNVSPGLGTRATRRIMSVFELPTTTTELRFGRALLFMQARSGF